MAKAKTNYRKPMFFDTGARLENPMMFVQNIVKEFLFGIR
jgi:hypothetical protein